MLQLNVRTKLLPPLACGPALAPQRSTKESPSPAWLLPHPGADNHFWDRLGVSKGPDHWFPSERKSLSSMVQIEFLVEWTNSAVSGGIPKLGGGQGALILPAKTETDSLGWKNGKKHLWGGRGTRLGAASLTTAVASSWEWEDGPHGRGRLYQRRCFFL